MKLSMCEMKIMVMVVIVTVKGVQPILRLIRASLFQVLPLFLFQVLPNSDSENYVFPAH